MDIFRYNVAVTDFQWFSLLAEQPGIDEVNFWQPSPSSIRDPVGTPWLFKLHSPKHFIVGGGIFVHYTKLPIGMAWEAFGIKNGVKSQTEMLSRVSKYRKSIVRDTDEIGCIVLSDPFFLDREEWIPIPNDWKSNIVKGKHYDTREQIGSDLWLQVVARKAIASVSLLPQGPSVGKPILVTPRLGQGGFRTEVTDAYDRRCAISGERTLPVLEAAHIRPFSDVGSHDVRNGLLLRSDIHKLFDRGYVSIQPDGIFRVSQSLRADFQNGKVYYDMDGKAIRFPSDASKQPLTAHLDWHFSTQFRE